MLDKRAAARASVNLTEYSREKGIYMKINYFNTDHTHTARLTARYGRDARGPSKSFDRLQQQFAA
jgi:hypothetical protein